MAIITPTAAWSAAVTLSSAEIWEIRGPSAVYLSTETTPANIYDGLRLWDREFVRFESGQEVKHRSDGPGAQIIRMPVL